MVLNGRLMLHDLSAQEAARCADLMKKYGDLPMDLADASLVAIAETRSLRTIFTLDEDFVVYRLTDGSALSVIPTPRSSNR